MDKQKADQIITEYLKKIYGFAIKKSYSYDEAEELCAEIVCEVYLSLRKADEIISMERYIWRISNYVYSKYVSSRKKHEGISIDGMQIPYWECDTILYHTELYEYRHGKMLMHLRFIFETLSELNSPGEYMRYYRQLRELTTRQLAEKLNIVPATVLAYEQGRFPIPYEISIAAAEMLHISEELLFDDFCVFISAPYTELLHTVRKRYGLSQVDFAQKAGISPSIYTKWEAGNRRPSRKMYRQLVTTYPEINI